MTFVAKCGMRVRMVRLWVRTTGRLGGGDDSQRVGGLLVVGVADCIVCGALRLKIAHAAMLRCVVGAVGPVPHTVPC